MTADSDESSEPPSMVAHLMSSCCQPGRCQDYIESYRKWIVPFARSSLGYRGMYLLTDRESGKALALSLWDTEGDALTYEHSLANMPHLTHPDDALVMPVQTDMYEVSEQA